MPGFIGFPELLLLGLVVLLVFGPKRLPEMGRSMGKGLREFKNSVTGDKHGIEEATIELPPGFPQPASEVVTPPALSDEDRVLPARRIAVAREHDQVA